MLPRDGFPEQERRRREVAVRLGRQQLLYLEAERKLEQGVRKIKEVLGTNQKMNDILEKIEREKQEELEDSELEKVRRKAVVKEWKLQVKVMERERQLEQMGIEFENMMRDIQQSINTSQEMEYKLEKVDRKENDPDKGNMFLEIENWILEKSGEWFQILTRLSSVMISLQETESQILQDLEEAGS